MLHIFLGEAKFELVSILKNISEKLGTNIFIKDFCVYWADFISK